MEGRAYAFFFKCEDSGPDEVHSMPDYVHFAPVWLDFWIILIGGWGGEPNREIEVGGKSSFGSRGRRSSCFCQQSRGFNKKVKF